MGLVRMGGDGEILQGCNAGQSHGPGNLGGNLQAGNLENLQEIDAELPVKRRTLVQMVLKHHFRVVLT